MKNQKVLIVALLAILLGGVATVLMKDRSPTPSTATLPANAVWIDVRSAQEYAQGHLDQAPRIAHNQIESGVAAMGLAKDAPIYLYCAAGGRAGQAKRLLEAKGYTNVTNAGGLEDARELVSGGTP